MQRAYKRRTSLCHAFAMRNRAYATTRPPPLATHGHEEPKSSNVDDLQAIVRNCEAPFDDRVKGQQPCSPSTA
jgi:hypothetical protein